MPKKTIYVRDSSMDIIEQAQEMFPGVTLGELFIRGLTREIQERKDRQVSKESIKQDLIQILANLDRL